MLHVCIEHGQQHQQQDSWALHVAIEVHQPSLISVYSTRRGHGCSGMSLLVHFNTTSKDTAENDVAFDRM